MILAGIDIGTNTIRLLVAETSDSSHREIHSSRKITRLGQGLDRTGVLAPDAQDRTFRALKEFAGIIGSYPVVGTAAVGTSALRNASNAREFIAQAKQRTGLDIAVISGEAEANLTLHGVRRALAKTDKAAADPFASSLVIDIGGGSTEIMAIRHGVITSMASLPLGAVYLTERFIHHDPPTREELDNLSGAVAQELDRLSSAGFRPGSFLSCAGTAGTITTLAAMDQGLAVYDPDRTNGYVLLKSALDRMVDRLAAASLDRRRKIAGLEPGREDIILAGAIIAREIMARCGATTMLVSDWGLREGIIFDLHQKLSCGNT